MKRLAFLNSNVCKVFLAKKFIFYLQTNVDIEGDVNFLLIVAVSNKYALKSVSTLYKISHNTKTIN